jgi:N6-adenosine-specific RNA methylase IME4
LLTSNLLDTKKYDIIYADPPWQYDFSKSASRAIEGYYATMTVEAICGLTIPSADNSVLYLWATAPKLLEALAVMQAWGFTYKTNAIWDKEAVGMGYWFRGQHELLLVGTKGKVSPPAQSVRVASVIRERRTTHSKKPARIRDLISGWFPDATKLELFARQATQGWDVWGNQIQSTVEINQGEHNVFSTNTNTSRFKTT